MGRKASPGMMVAVLLGYALLLAAILYFLPYPWQYAVASLVLFKGLVFWAVMRRASGLGTGRTRRLPP